MAEQEFRVLVHEEEGSYWAEVPELPGCFGSGRTLDELREAITEAIALYLTGHEPAISTAPAALHGRVDEMRILVPSPS